MLTPTPKPLSTMQTHPIPFPVFPAPAPAPFAKCSLYTLGGFGTSLKQFQTAEILPTGQLVYREPRKRTSYRLTFDSRALAVLVQGQDCPEPPPAFREEETGIPGLVSSVSLWPSFAPEWRGQALDFFATLDPSTVLATWGADFERARAAAEGVSQ